MGAFPFVRLIGFSRAATDSRMGIAPLSFPIRETRPRGEREEQRDEEDYRLRANAHSSKCDYSCHYNQVSLLRLWNIR